MNIKLNFNVYASYLWVLCGWSWPYREGPSFFHHQNQLKQSWLSLQPESFIKGDLEKLNNCNKWIFFSKTLGSYQRTSWQPSFCSTSIQGRVRAGFILLIFWESVPVWNVVQDWHQLLLQKFWITWVSYRLLTLIERDTSVLPWQLLKENHIMLFILGIQSFSPVKTQTQMYKPILIHESWNYTFAGN